MKWVEKIWIKTIIFVILFFLGTFLMIIGRGVLGIWITGIAMAFALMTLVDSILELRKERSRKI